MEYRPIRKHIKLSVCGRKTSADRIWNC